MKMFVEQGVPTECLKELNNILHRYSLESRMFRCEINEDASFNEIYSWAVNRFEEKVIIITKRGIKTNSINLAVNCKGISDDIGGRLAVISFTSPAKFPEICLHEMMHLEGLTHCHNNGCLMSVKLCDNDIKYCVLCENRCAEMKLCEECDSLWKGKSKLKSQLKMDL